TIALLAGPILVNNVATAGMAFVDTLMIGRLGTQDLAAVAVGATCLNVFYLGGLGLLMSLSPLVAHAYGGGRDALVGGYLRQALWLAAGLSIVALAALLATHPALLAIGIAPAVATLAARYVRAASLGLPALFMFLALRFSSEGIGWTRPILFTALIALGVKILGNYLLIYGRLGLPALGAVGCGVVSSIADVVILGVMLMYMRRHARYRPFALFARFEWPDATKLREILALGIPIGGSVLAEGALFASAALIVGGFGATMMAAHAIAINYAWIMFTVPLSLHSATTIHVGHRLGRADVAAGRFAGWVGIALCAAVMAVSAVVLVLARAHIAALYTHDPAVLRIAARLLLFAAAFQIADGTQVGSSGALRGFKDARVPLFISTTSYWLVAFPFAYYFGVVRQGGAYAVWTGLVAGLSLCALLLVMRYEFIARRTGSQRASR
ncbi:MAG TPA: MATE family efflux transporter, partial [Steroidobacteraceae bacterium]